jgi:Coenzyme PQQ synthesis protein D (PqqD)
MARIDSRIVHDVFDGEVMAVRNDTGAYYSLRGVAADLWNGIAAGLDDAGLAAMLCRRYDTESAAAIDVVHRFLGHLSTEGLVDNEHAVDDATAVTLLPALDPRLPLEDPVVETYTDMQDLLQFDPIHEVGPEGWPQRAS